MQIDYQFTDFESTPAIYEFMEKRFQTIKKRIDARFHHSKVFLRGSVLARTPQGKAKKFLAELSVKVPRSKAPYIVKKSKDDFHAALSEAVQAMEKLLRRDSEKMERSRKTVGKSLKSVRKVKRGQATLK